SKITQDKIDQSLERLNSSIKLFKEKLKDFNIDKPLEKYNEFYLFEKLYYLRTHDNQLQQELNNLQNQNLNQNQLITSEKIQTFWSKKLENSMFKTDQSITTLAKDIIENINENLFKEKINFNENEEFEENNSIQPPSIDVTDEVKKNLKIDFSDKISALKQISLNLIAKEKCWEKQKDIIHCFDLMKKNLIENYFRSKNFDTNENPIKTKNLKDILIQCDVEEWNQEIDDLSMHLFTTNLLQSYAFNFEILRQQNDFIEESMKEKQDD
ncbi:unnamed protein product, partial [Didymodactylos carnosus]